MATVFSHALVGCMIVSLFPKKLRIKKIYLTSGVFGAISITKKKSEYHNKVNSDFFCWFCEGKNRN